LRQPDVDFSIYQFTDKLNSNYHQSTSNSQSSFDINKRTELKAQHHSSVLPHSSIINALSESRTRDSMTGLLFSMPPIHKNALKQFAAEQEKLLKQNPSSTQVRKMDQDDSFTIDNAFEDYQV